MHARLQVSVCSGHDLCHPDVMTYLICAIALSAISKRPFGQAQSKAAMKNDRLKTKRSSSSSCNSLK